MGREAVARGRRIGPVVAAGAIGQQDVHPAESVLVKAPAVLRPARRIAIEERDQPPRPPDPRGIQRRGRVRRRRIAKAAPHADDVALGLGVAMQRAGDAALAMDILEVEVMRMGQEPRPVERADHQQILRPRHAAHVHMHRRAVTEPGPRLCRADRKVRHLPQFLPRPIGGFAAKHPAHGRDPGPRRPARILPGDRGRARAIDDGPVPAEDRHGLRRLDIAVGGERALLKEPGLDQNPVGPTGGIARGEGRVDRAESVRKIAVRGPDPAVGIVAGRDIDMERRPVPDCRVDEVARFLRDPVATAPAQHGHRMRCMVPAQPCRHLHPANRGRRRHPRPEPDHQVSPVIPVAVVPVAATRRARTG